MRTLGKKGDVFEKSMFIAIWDFYNVLCFTYNL